MVDVNGFKHFRPAMFADGVVGNLLAAHAGEAGRDLALGVAAGVNPSVIGVASLTGIGLIHVGPIPSMASCGSSNCSCGTSS